MTRNFMPPPPVRQQGVRVRIRTADVAMMLALPPGFAGLVTLPAWPRFWWLFAVAGGLLVVSLAAMRGERLSRISPISAAVSAPRMGHNRRSEHGRRGHGTGVATLR